jgi:hypothetical protein
VSFALIGRQWFTGLFDPAALTPGDMRHRSPACSPRRWRRTSRSSTSWCDWLPSAG